MAGDDESKLISSISPAAAATRFFWNRRRLAVRCGKVTPAQAMQSPVKKIVASRPSKASRRKKWMCVFTFRSAWAGRVGSFDGYTLLREIRSVGGEALGPKAHGQLPQLGSFVAMLAASELLADAVMGLFYMPREQRQ